MFKAEKKTRERVSNIAVVLDKEEEIISVCEMFKEKEGT